MLKSFILHFIISIIIIIVVDILHFIIIIIVVDVIVVFLYNIKNIKQPLCVDNFFIIFFPFLNIII